MTRRRWLAVGLIVAGAVLVAGRALARSYVEYDWYAAMGATDVWRARLASSIILRAMSGLVATLFVFANLYAVRHSVVSLVLPRRIANLEIGEEVPGRYLMIGVVALSIVLGALLTLPQDDWSSLLLARSGTPFGEYDPYFRADLGFFVYWLPFESGVYYWTLISILIVTALVLFLYALTPSLRWDRGAIYVSAHVRRHIMVLAGVLIAMLGWSFRLDMYTLLSNGSGPDGAFTYVDHVIGVPGSLLLALACLGAACIVVWSGWTGQIRLGAVAVVGVLVLSVVVRQAAPFVARRWADERDPATRERPYESTRAGYTRRAFAVGRMGPTDSLVQYASLGDAGRQISEWDPTAIARAADRTRTGVPGTTAIGWRLGATGLVAEVVERPRLVDTVLDTGPSSWSLTRVLASVTDEHGGLVRVNAEGVPTLDETTLERPLVFEGAAGWIIVADSLDRIAGAPLDGLLARVAHAWSFQRPAILLGDLVHPRPTVVGRRDVRDRLKALAPFFVQGTVVVPVLAGDTLYWSIDLYSASSSYPLSQRILVAGDQRNYFQHAATALVRAATGAVLIVPDSLLDPIATTWVRRFPGLFTQPGALPESLAASLPPAIDGLLAQAIAFGKYGTRANSDRPRHIPDLSGADSAAVGEDAPFGVPLLHEIAVAIPLLDLQSERVRGLVIGIGGASHATLWYPLLESGPRWPSIIDRLRNADSAALGHDLPVVRGNIRAFPLRGDAAYVQSSYRWRAVGTPELTHITLLGSDSVRTEPSLALIAGRSGEQTSHPTPGPGGDVRLGVDSLYRAMRAALRRGDWSGFGRAFDALGRALGGNHR